ncbi:MAG: FprA family A-type flavoprotein [Desulfuromonas thiophila]|nr:FprA family A-type flavoprotein [Desulfuromonas thiophila]
METEMTAIAVTPRLHWVGAYDPQLRIFDELYPTRSGTTYNAYLLQLGGKNILFDTVEEHFFDQFYARLTSVCAIADIDLLVTQHTEHDHAGSIGRLLQLNPRLKVYGSQAALRFLGQQLNREFAGEAVKEGQVLELGEGAQLQFVLAPFLHWPDTIFSYLPTEQVLISGDAFGAHFCPAAGRLFDDEVSNFQADFQMYFDTIVRPFKSQVQDALKKALPLDIRTICPSHGPVRRRRVTEALTDYDRWSTLACAEGRRILLLEHSPHGTTRAMGDRVTQRLEAQGCTVVRFKAVELDEARFQDELECADALVIGAATINRDAGPPVWRALVHLSTVTPKNRLALVYGAYGWSGEAVKLIEERLLGQRYKLAAPGVRWQFSPTESDIAACLAQVDALLAAL